MKLHKQGLAASTVNKTMLVAKTALRWVAANEKIPIDPTIGLRGFAGPKEMRGILTEEEAKALFEIDWEDSRAQVAAMMAMTTGMRMGEVLAIQRQDIADTQLSVRHSFSIKDGLKLPKNGEVRKAFLFPEVRDALLALEAFSPHPQAPDRFVFAGRYPERPLDANRILEGFRKALVAMQGGSWDDKEARNRILASFKARAIDFHSWRHYYAKHIADRVEARTGQLGTGHKSLAMFEYYAKIRSDEDMRRLAEATKDEFGRLLPKDFRIRSAA